MQKAAPALLCCSNRCRSNDCFLARSPAIPQLFASLLLLGVILYLLGWVTKAEAGKLAAWIRKSSAILLVGGVTLIFTRNPGLAIMAGMIAYSIMGRTGWYPGKGRGAAKGNASTMRSSHLEMSLDHDTNVVSGRILQGRFVNRSISDLSTTERLDFLAELRLSDAQGTEMFEAYLDRTSPGWRNSGKESGARGTETHAMNVDEAYRVLELNSTATREDVFAAHRNLIARTHPDQGGSTYLASQVNEAKDVLLKHIKS